MTGEGVNVVIGVGNRMRRDDAAGPVVVDRLQGKVPRGVHLVESIGDPVSLLGWWQSASLAVVVDAVKTGSKPGTVFRFNGHDSLPSAFFRQSTHLVGLADAVQMARTLDRMPGVLVLFGIEAQTMDYGEEISPAVHAALDGVVDSILEMFPSSDSPSSLNGATNA
jgi:hydrogenase maturation protease